MPYQIDGSVGAVSITIFLRHLHLKHVNVSDIRQIRHTSQIPSFCQAPGRLGIGNHYV